MLPPELVPPTAGEDEEGESDDDLLEDLEGLEEDVGPEVSTGNLDWSVLRCPASLVCPFILSALAVRLLCTTVVHLPPSACFVRCPPFALFPVLLQGRGSAGGDAEAVGRRCSIRGLWLVGWRTCHAHS